MNFAGKYSYVILRILLLGIFTISLLIFTRSLFYDSYPDFGVYYDSVNLLIRGENPYTHNNHFGTFIYPPSSFLFLTPFTAIPLALSQKIFTFISIICFFASVFLLFKISEIKVSSNLSLFILILSLNFFPAKFTLGMGQINNLMLLFMTLFIFFYLRGKAFAGIFLGLSISIKLLPILPVLFLIFKKKWGVLFYMFVTLTAIIFLTLLFVRPEIFYSFLYEVVPSLAGIKDAYYNQALSGFLSRMDLGNENILSAIIGILLVLFSVIFIWKFKEVKKESLLLLIGFLITLNLVINSFSWQHHFVWLIIPFIFTLYFIRKNKLGFKYYAALFISYLLVATNLKDPSAFPILIQSHAFYGAVLLGIININMIQKMRAKTDMLK